ncbi:helix-turn-helix domain-containing protein [Corallococcus exercitus]|uniref:Helix-turn-helix domain-containing protein n=1 Tax=Corallococcus exercitus TaxID=2316736 RepID=A0A7Y4KHA8_9BACT|nr:helix-turn-helix domain-containing protein [Corallococcus exercitus]NOK33255.1 helix-turn-helix domain-containing protein [Corallococcus exercitus]
MLRSILASVITHVVLDGVAEGPLGIGLDVVNTAARLVEAGLAPVPRGAKPLRQRVVSLDGRPVRSGTGRAVAVDGALSLRSVKAGDVLLVPGLSAATERAIEHLLSRADTARVGGLLSRAAAKGAVVAASCSATFVLAAAGLLTGRSATMTWWLVPAFVRRFPQVTVRSDRMVVESEGVFTAGSAFAHADLMLGIVARVASPSLAHLVARYLLLDERASQARYMVMEHLRVSDPALSAVERFVAANLGRQLTLDELAQASATSTRTLARRIQAGLGMTPLEFVQRVRMAHASHLLETTHESVEAISLRVGYADAAAFRRVYKRYAGETPRGRALVGSRKR